MKVIISSYNSLGDGRYYDVETSSSFVFDHTTQVCVLFTSPHAKYRLRMG